MAKAKPIPFVDPEASLFVHAAVAIGTRMDEILAFEPIISNPDEVLALHEMRISAKRMRYTMDLFLPAFNEHSRFGSGYNGAIAEVKLLQQHLGDIHDADVLVPRLLSELEQLLKHSLTSGKKDVPKVGVHIADLDSAQGLLSLSQQSRTQRDEVWQQLQVDWQRMRESLVFENLRKLLRAAVTEETLAAVLHEEPGSITESAATVTDPQSGATSGEHSAQNGELANEAKRKRRESKQRKPRTEPANNPGIDDGNGAG